MCGCVRIGFEGGVDYGGVGWGGRRTLIYARLVGGRCLFESADRDPGLSGCMSMRPWGLVRGL